MNRWHAFSQLVLARVREFFREPEAIFWVYGFPLILAIGLGVAFSQSEPERPIVDIQASPDDPEAQKLAKKLRDDGIQVEIHSEEEASRRLKREITALYLVPEPKGIRYVYDPARTKDALARRWVEAVLARSQANQEAPVVDAPITDPGGRYIDFLLPGLIGMNLMGGGLFGIGFVLVDMRVRKLFKRMMATPVRRDDFLLSLLTARMFFLLPEMLALLLIARLIFSVPIYGSFFTLMLVILLGAFAFAGLGLLLGCRTEKTETMSGLINLVMLPMYLFSGIFFSAKRFPDAIQPFVQALPLTQLNDALREVMLEGAGFLDVAWRLGILAAWAGATFFLALRWFKWK